MRYGETMDRELAGRVLEIIEQAFVTIGQDQLIRSVNHGAREMFGYEEGEIVGQPLEMLIPRRFRDIHRYHVGAFVQSPEITRRMNSRREIFALRKDGTIFVAEATITKIRHAEGLVLAVLLDDISQRRHAEVALRQASEGLERAVEQRTRLLVKSQQSLAKAQRIAHIGNWDWNIQTGELYWSDEIYRIFGLSPQEFGATYEAFMERVHPDDRAMVQGTVNRAIGGREPYVLYHRIIRPDGMERIVYAQGEVEFSDDGQPAIMSGTVQDVTRRRRDEERLRLAATFFENSREALMVTDPEANIVEVNEAFIEMTGYGRDEVIGKNPRILKSGRHDREFYRGMWEGLKLTGRWQGEVWDRRKDGSIYPKWLSISAVLDDEGRVTHYVCVATDITAIKQTEERLQYLAHYDMLTGLPNRLLLRDRMSQALGTEQRHGHRLAVMMLDLDGFKKVNDSLGHRAGDMLLKLVAARLKRIVRQSDTVSRLGGDEFIILLSEVMQIEDPAKAAAKILDEIGKPMMLEGREVFITASIGISMYPEDGGDMDELMRHADTAMYHAKGLGKQRYQYFTRDMNVQIERRLELEASLRRAFERRGLTLHYQPRVDMGSGRVTGVEALLRWRRKDGSYLPPSIFIPVAEEAGMIREIGAWVLHEAASQCARWLRAGVPPVRVSVNVSARQLEDGWLGPLVRRVLGESGLSPEALELEITESVIMRDVDENVAILGEIKSLGVMITLDDFGTGYSSLNYLNRFPIDALKVDRSFVAGVPGNVPAEKVVSAIIALGHSLNLKVVAEGVESEGQLRFLLDRDCNEIQGYYFSRPLDADSVERFIRAGGPLAGL